jgi:hypothetical protein
LLLFSDAELICLIDDLVFSKLIDIPPSEVRIPKSLNEKEWSTELSSLGIRSSLYPAIIGLHGEIWAAYKKLGILEDLRWRVRSSQPGEPSLRIALMDFIRSHGPAGAVKDLVLPSRDVTKALEADLWFKVEPQEKESESIAKILWKFGFTVARYGREQHILKQRTSDFKAAVLKLPSHPGEEDYAAVRSIGVNLFISVESLLQDVIAFNSWLLSSDHFSLTRFAYSKSDALIAVKRMLGDSIKSGGQTFTWDVGGHNALGTELVYLMALRDWLAGRPQADATTLLREETDFPHYWKGEFVDFPFRHSELWADCSPEMLAEYSRLVDELYQQASQADFAGVRNGIDHKREEGDFPSSDRMLGCASRLEQIADMVDHRSLIPKLIWPTKMEQDSFGNITFSYEDSSGIVSNFKGPTSVLGLSHQYRPDLPYIAAPLNLLGLPNSELRFTVNPKSEYSSYWADYPKRLLVKQVDEDDETSGQAQSEKLSDEEPQVDVTVETQLALADADIAV